MSVLTRKIAEASGLTNLEVITEADLAGYTSIGDEVFCGCSSLTSITIPNRVTSIGVWAFVRCSSLTSITIPNRITSIGEGVFADCSSLTSITIPNRVTSIGGVAFIGCSSLESITIPEGVACIDNGAFLRCVNINRVVSNFSKAELVAKGLPETCRVIIHEELTASVELGKLLSKHEVFSLLPEGIFQEVMKYSHAPGASESAYNISNEKANESLYSSVFSNYLDKLSEDDIDEGQAMDTSFDTYMEENIKRHKIGD